MAIKKSLREKDKKVEMKLIIEYDLMNTRAMMMELELLDVKWTTQARDEQIIAYMKEQLKRRVFIPADERVLIQELIENGEWKVRRDD